MTASPQASFVLIGTDSLLLQCAEILLRRGHELRAIISAEPAIGRWAGEREIRVLDPAGDYATELGAKPFDYLFSITNFAIIPARALELPRRAAVNFHDGPLPAYGGMHATAWALIDRQPRHGITWHLMTDAVDEGGILAQRHFDVAEGETSLTLNAKAYEAAIESFGALVDDLLSGRVQPAPHSLDRATYHGRSDRPAGACTLRWSQPAADLAALARALDFGGYVNPLGVPKLLVAGEVLLAPEIVALPSDSAAAPGTVLAIDARGLVIATAGGDVAVPRLMTADGEALDVETAAGRFGIHVGDTLPELDDETAARVGALHRRLAPHEPSWVRRLAALEPADVPYASRGTAPAEAPRPEVRTLPLPAGLARLTTTPAGEGFADVVSAAFGVFLSKLAGKPVLDIAFRDRALAARLDGSEPWFASHVPLRVALEGITDASGALDAVRREIAWVRERGTYCRDVVLRHPSLRGAARPALAVGIEQVREPHQARGAERAAVTLVVGDDPARLTWISDASLIAGAQVERMHRQFAAFLGTIAGAPDRPLTELAVLTEEERAQVVESWNDTAAAVPDVLCVHELIEDQAARTPDAVAAVFEDTSLTYAELNARANRLARRLRALGVGPDVLVGLCTERSLDMLVGLLAVHKAGGAYVPLDPGYPRERLAFMLEDSRAPVLLTQQRLLEELPPYAGAVVCIDRADAGPEVSSGNLGRVAEPHDLAYVIYTSGSTGRPKGVMVEHRNVVNFFAGMDERLGTERGTWLAVTSLSFDISVLELLWTLARGFTVVVFADDRGAAARAPGAGIHKGLDFSLFYFAADEGEPGEKYRLLMEGARFADRNGFVAVWTPERHFHAFGGLYPNPAVTGAAVAAITERVQIRAGSVVLPLHHPMRVAEEWSVVDNISRGRVGISFAPGWQPNDFVLRPESFADAKGVLMRDIDVVRRLWRGESLTVRAPNGKDVELRTLPRPVQPELPFWLTTAGTPESFTAAGRMGANLLTHLLGQSVEELAGKIALYRQAWTEAGHAGAGRVSLMLHTFVGEDDAAVKELVRAPLTEYLRTSIGLIKQYAATFPTLRNKPGGGVDFAALSKDEMEALLAYSFERYYETSGLFGTLDTCTAMVERLEAIDVDEIACLIDFGVATDLVLAHLDGLNALRERCSRPRAARDHSVPALLARHGVTHMQATPSMAGMLLADPRTRGALRGLRALMIGGEAFPPALAAELRSLVGGAVHNMYGPTETTIWSATYRLNGAEPSVPIGRPIANTELYVVDAHGQPLPPGAPGELLIGGAGVVRGYLGRPELTAERFIADRFKRRGAGRLYRTGDLARWRPDGQMEFLGRLDHQIKIRGYRVELGEIEALLERMPSVREAVVIAREDTPGDKRLVAYVVPRPGTTPTPAALRDALRAALPEYMVPAHVVMLSSLPRTPNAKIDRRALPAPDGAATAAAAYVPPRNELEQEIASIWQDVLQLPQVGTRDNFFDLGGHSLLAVQVHGRLRDRLARDLSITDLFRFPTIRALTDFLESGDTAAVGTTATLQRAEARREAMLRRRPRRN